MSTATQVSLSSLRKLLEEQQVWFGNSSPTSLHTKHAQTLLGIPAIDDALVKSGFRAGSVHEWSLEDNFSTGKSLWYPPLSIISLLVKNLFLKEENRLPLRAVWIGKKCWPMPAVMEGALLKRSVFVNAHSTANRLWAALEALRASYPLIVIVDGSKFYFKDTRRLQLASQKGASICLLMRPAWEIARSSAAHSKWKLSTVPSASESLCWELELVKARGIRSPQLWPIEWTYNEKNTLCLSSNVVSRPHQKTKTHTENPESKHKIRAVSGVSL